jgi:hypothetical protein
LLPVHVHADVNFLPAEVNLFCIFAHDVPVFCR